MTTETETAVADTAGLTFTVERRGQWDAGDVAQLGIDYTSVTRDGVDADSLFPEQPITPSELGAEA